MSKPLYWPPMLPCPFCGGQVPDAFIREGGTYRWFVTSFCCGWEIELRRTNGRNDPVDDQIHRNEAAAEWNKRAPTGAT